MRYLLNNLGKSGNSPRLTQVEVFGNLLDQFSQWRDSEESEKTHGLQNKIHLLLIPKTVLCTELADRLDL
jgi:hypothetical protein